MVVSKKPQKTNLGIFIFYLFIIIFPYGQLMRANIHIAGFTLPFQIIDFITGLSVFFITKKSLKSDVLFVNFKTFVVTLLFSQLFSLILFKPTDTFVGWLYFFRVLIYCSFYLLILDLVKVKKLKRQIFLLLQVSLILIASFGWLQYIYFPDLISLKYLGWDDHLFRMTGTYLDPGFLAILLVLGCILAFSKYIYNGNKLNLFSCLLLVFTLAFSYARAAYLALVVGVVALVMIYKKGYKASLLVLSVFAAVILMLPKNSASEGTKLTRVASVIARIDNYKESISIAGLSPVFGVGFNNLCIAKINYLHTSSYNSHSCSGADSSLLLILATTGIVGLLLFVVATAKTYQTLMLHPGFWANTTLASGLALLVNSLFINSLFYPWVIGWFVILAAFTNGEIDKKLRRISNL